MWCYPEGRKRESNPRRQNASRLGDVEVMFSLPPPPLTLPYGGLHLFREMNFHTEHTPLARP